MTESNKGRFKCKDEAQAVWNFFIQIYSTYDVNAFKKGCFIAQSCFSLIANNLHDCGLIHGSIYDEFGRIDDKDVAHEIASILEIDFFIDGMNDSEIHDACEYILDCYLGRNKIRGTIFY